MQPCCGSRERSESSLTLRSKSKDDRGISPAVPAHEVKSEQKELQTAQLKSDLEQQKSQHAILAALVEELQSKHAKLQTQVKRIEDSTVQLLQENGSKTKTLTDLDARLNDVQQDFQQLSLSRQQAILDEASDVIVEEQTEELPPPPPPLPVSAEVEQARSRQINNLQAEVEKLSVWRSKVDAEFKSLQSQDRAPRQDSSEVVDVSARGEKPPPPSSASLETEESHVDIIEAEGTHETSKRSDLTTASSRPYGPKLPTTKSTDKESIKRHYHLHREYMWSESVYDALFLVRLNFITPTHTCLLIYGFLLNLIIVMLIVANIDTEEFATKPFKDNGGLERWRLTEGHSYLNTNPMTGMTLVMRVCNMDEGLSIGTYQKEAIETIDTYLADMWGITQQGRVLCTIALLAWYFHCALEIRRTINFGIAIYSLPRAEHTAVAVSADGFSFVSLSTSRVVLGVTIAAVRFLFGVFLLYFGSRWLAYETNIVDLLLNASALAFVLDIDNTIFGICAPYRIVGLMRSLQPVRLPKNHSLIAVPLVLILFKIVFMVFVNVLTLQDVVSGMEAARAILCEPEEGQTFLVGKTPMNWITFTDNTPTWDEFQSYSHNEQVTRGIVIESKRGSVAYPMGGFDDILHAAGMSIEGFVNENRFRCADGNGMPKEDPHLGNRLWGSTANASLRSLRGCSDAKQYCFEDNLVGVNMRLICPCTCGCADLQAGLWDLAKAEHGCPAESCWKKASEVLAGNSQTCGVHGDGSQIACQDNTLSSLGQIGWRPMLDRMRDIKDIPEDVYSNLTTLGCAGLQYLPENQLFTLCSMREPVVCYGIAPFCPEACHCRKAKSFGFAKKCPGLCPHSCCHAEGAVWR